MRKQTSDSITDCSKNKKERKKEEADNKEANKQFNKWLFKVRIYQNQHPRTIQTPNQRHHLHTCSRQFWHQIHWQKRCHSSHCCNQRTVPHKTWNEPPTVYRHQPQMGLLQPRINLLHGRLCRKCIERIWTYSPHTTHLRPIKICSTNLQSTRPICDHWHYAVAQPLDYQLHPTCHWKNFYSMPELLITPCSMPSITSQQQPLTAQKPPWQQPNISWTIQPAIPTPKLSTT